MSDLKNRFKNRWIVVIEQQYVVKEPTFTYRSFACRSDAISLMNAIERKNPPGGWRHCGLVDRDNPGSVILP
jgi:hypothetical protein